MCKLFIVLFRPARMFFFSRRRLLRCSHRVRGGAGPADTVDEGRVRRSNAVGWCSCAVLRTRGLARARIPLLLFVHLVERLADDVVLGPVHGRAPYDVLGLRDCGEPGALLVRSVDLR